MPLGTQHESSDAKAERTLGQGRPAKFAVKVGAQRCAEFNLVAAQPTSKPTTARQKGIKCRKAACPCDFLWGGSGQIIAHG